MPSDPAISLSFKPTVPLEDPQAMLSKGIQLQDLMSQNRLRQQQVLQSQQQTQDLQAQTNARNKALADTQTFQKNLLDSRKPDGSADWGKALDASTGFIDPEMQLKIQKAHIEDVTNASKATDEDLKTQQNVFGQMDKALQGIRGESIPDDQKNIEWQNFMSRSKADPQLAPYMQKGIDMGVLAPTYSEDMAKKSHAVVVGHLGTLTEAKTLQETNTSAATQAKDQQELINLQKQQPGIEADAVTKVSHAPVAQAIDKATLMNPGLLTPEQQAQQKNAEKAQQTAAGHLWVAQQDLALKSAKQKMEMGADTVQTWVDTLKHNPDAVKEVPTTVKNAVASEFTKQTGLPMPTAAGSTTVGTETAARNALANAAWIKNAIKDPEIQKRLGTILGNLGEAEQNLGTAVAGLSPHASQIAQELRTRMRYFVFQEGKTTLGGRLPQQLMRALEQSSASVHMEAPMLNGALDGAVGSSNVVLDNIDKERFGGVARPRVMRGLAPGKLYSGPGGHTLASDDDGRTFYNPQTGERDIPRGVQ
jgi:hypothetical protein